MKEYTLNHQEYKLLLDIANCSKSILKDLQQGSINEYTTKRLETYINKALKTKTIY